MQRVMVWSELHGDMQIEAEMTSRRQLCRVSVSTHVFQSVGTETSVRQQRNGLQIYTPSSSVTDVISDMHSLISAIHATQMTGLTDCLNCNGGAQRFPQAGWQSAVECNGKRELDCETYKSSRCESRA